MEQDTNLYGLNQRLFWDIDTRNFNIDESAAWIIQRVLEYGTMKDWNFLLQHYTLEEILGFYLQKYPQYSMFRVRMSLTYFEDAENQEDPKMFEKVGWKTIKESIAEAVRKVNWNHFIDK